MNRRAFLSALAALSFVGRRGAEADAIEVVNGHGETGVIREAPGTVTTLTDGWHNGWYVNQWCDGEVVIRRIDLGCAADWPEGSE